jgi:hypothetical protein
LEKEAAAIPDPFLRKAMSLAIDGADDFQDLRRIIEVDIGILEQSAEAEDSGDETPRGHPSRGTRLWSCIRSDCLRSGVREYLLSRCSKTTRPASRKSVDARDAYRGHVRHRAGSNPTLIRLKLESFTPATSGPKTGSKGSKAGAPCAAGAKRSREAA